MPDFTTMVTIEREMERRFEQACEKDGWTASVAISENSSVSLLLEKFGEEPVMLDDENKAVHCFAHFIEEEFGVELKAERTTETIPNTRNPHHVSFHSIINAQKRISQLVG